MRGAAPLQKRPIQTSRQAQTHTDEREPATASIRPRPSLTVTNLGPGPHTDRDHTRLLFFFFFLHFYLFILVSLPPLDIYIFWSRACSSIHTPPPVPVRAARGRTFWTMLEDELTAAAAKGDAAQVRSLLGAGAQVNGVNCFGRTALQVSVTVSNFCRRRWRWGSPSTDNARIFFLHPLKFSSGPIKGVYIGLRVIVSQ